MSAVVLNAVKAAVKQAYPKTFAQEWQGVWRIYKEDLLYDSRLTFGGSDSEAEAWEYALEVVEDERRKG